MSKSNDVAIAVAFLAGLRRVLEDTSSDAPRPGPEIAIRALVQASGSYVIAEALHEIDDAGARTVLAAGLAGLGHAGVAASEDDDWRRLFADTFRVASGSVSLLSAVDVAANAIHSVLGPALPASQSGPLQLGQEAPARARAPRVFVSHSWAESEDFFTLQERIKAETTFFDHSVHIGKAFEYVADAELDRRLKDHIRGVDVVLVLAHEKTLDGPWVRREIEIAAEMGKPIVAVRPHGFRNRALHPLLRDAAVEQVGWSAPAVARRIHKWADIVQMVRAGEVD